MSTCQHFIMSSCQILSISVIFLAIFGTFWQFLTSFGLFFVAFLATFGFSHQLLATFVNFCPLLSTFGIFGNPWQHLAFFTKLCLLLMSHSGPHFYLLRFLHIEQLGETRSERVEYKSFGREIQSPHLSMLHRVEFVVSLNLLIQSTLDYLGNFTFKLFKQFDKSKLLIRF